MHFAVYHTYFDIATALEINFQITCTLNFCVQQIIERNVLITDQNQLKILVSCHRGDCNKIRFWMFVVLDY